MVPKSIFNVKRTFDTLNKGSKLASVAIRRQSVWSQDNVIRSPYKDVEIPNSTLSDYVWQNLDRWPERTVSVCAITGRGYTYEQAFKLSNKFAANLRIKFKINDGDVIAVMLPNIPDYPLVNLGILEAGGVITSINPIYTAHEIQRQLLLSKAKVVITLPETSQVIKDALKIAKLDVPIIVVKTNGNPTPEACGRHALMSAACWKERKKEKLVHYGWTTIITSTSSNMLGTVCFNELTEDQHVDTSVLKSVRRNINDICFLPYSSGTTGLPKGVELSHRNIIANGEQVNDEGVRCHNETTATHQDSVLAVLPFFHIYAASVIMFHKMSLGCKIVTLPKLQPELFFNTIEKHKTNTLFVAPPLILFMGSHPLANEKTYQHIEILVNGAAPISNTDVDRLVDKIKRDIDFRQGYGLTETSPTVTLTPRNSQKKDYSATGPPIANTELRIVDANLNNLGPNETGEILVRGPQVMRGYRDNPQANNEAFTVDGWFRTGDLAVADEDGSITIADRLKELIKVKGYQVPPAELEAVLRQHPAVNDAAVIGVPHPVNGEAPKAFIVLKSNQNCQTKDIVDFVTERVAPYKRVTDVSIIDAIPKSSSGKILRRVLKENYC